MRVPAGVSKAIATSATAVAVFLLFFAVERPWFVRWGATDAEVARTLPGDDLVPDARVRTTRAVTIDVPTVRVWPWVAQLGQDRAGFYSYEVLEDLAGCEMPGATRIMPGRQGWKPGERLWMYPPDKLDGLGGARVVAYKPGEYLVFATHQIGTPPDFPEDGTWGFYIEPTSEGSTRLIARGRAAGASTPLATAFSLSVFEPAHHAMERRMLLNIKALAEGRRTSRAADNMAVALWTLTVALVVASLVEVVRRERWVRPLAVAAGAALAYQLLTLVQPAPWVGAVLVVILATGLWWRAGDQAERSSGLAPLDGSERDLVVPSMQAG